LSVDELSGALAKLGKNIAEVAGGNRTSDAAKAFQVLGINVRDSSGQIKTSTDVYAEAADKLAAYKEGANKTAIEVALFGRGGAEMAAMLNKGTQGIADQRAEMEKLGIVIDSKTFKAAEAFNKEIHTMSSVIDSVVIRITVALLPVMQQLTTQFADSAKEMKSWEGTAYLIDGVVKVISTGFAGLSAVLFYNTDLFGRIFKALYTAASGDMAKAWEIISNVQSPIAAVSSAWEKIKGIWTAGAGEVVSIADRFRFAFQDAGAAADAFNKYATKLKDAPSLSAAAFAKAMDDLKLKTRDAEGEFATLGPGFLSAAQGLNLITGNVDKFNGAIALANPQMAQLSQRLLELKGAQITQENIEPWEQYNQTMTTLNATMAAGNLSVESYQRASTKAAAVIAESWGAAAAAIVSPMASAFKDLASINKQYAGAAKAFAIGEAIINTYLAATKAYAAFAYFPPLAIAAAAAAVAAGIANVVKISSTQFATGGSFTVGGGLTHVDSQLVAFNATPGEMVDVRRPGQEGYSGGVQEIELTGIKANDLFTGDMLRQLFHSLNAGMADGYKLMVPA